MKKPIAILSDTPSYPSGPRVPSEVTSAPWEAVPPQYDVSDFGENDNSNKVIVAPPAIQNEINKVDSQRRRYDSSEEYNVSENSPLEQNSGNEIFSLVHPNAL